MTYRDVLMEGQWWSPAVRVVPEESALGGLEHSHRVDADHMQVCKPESRTAVEYYPLMNTIRLWVPRAGPQSQVTFQHMISYQEMPFH